MYSLHQRQSDANSHLSRYAVQHGGGLGRQHPEVEDDERFPFQRDRDRIVSTDAFRRLSGKMQVLPPSFSDHIRNRSTHTIEVANLSRTLARALRTNEDFAECLGLVHDIGHPPFGHAGESALERCTNGAFEHNQQSLRIVTTLAYHSAAYPGLNLSQEITNGMQKHSGKPNYLEGLVVDIADTMTYTAHDPEDAIDAKILTLEQMRTLELGRRALHKNAERGTTFRGAILALLAADFLQETRARIERLQIDTLEDVLQCREPIVGFSTEMSQALAEFRQFLLREFYNHPAVLEHSSRGQQIVTDLFHHYMQEPTAPIVELEQRTGDSLERSVTDYISGMTDEFAEKALDAL